MASDNHGDKTQEEPQAQEDLGQQQAAQDQPQASGTDWERAVAERDERIAAIEAQVAEAARNAETAEQLRGEIAELKAQGESACAMAHTLSACRPTQRWRGATLTSAVSGIAPSIAGEIYKPFDALADPHRSPKLVCAVTPSRIRGGHEVLRCRSVSCQRPRLSSTRNHIHS